MDDHSYVFEIFALDPFERHCVGLALGAEIDAGDDRPSVPPTVGDALASYDRPLTVHEAYRYFDRDRMLMACFFQPPGNALFMERPLRLCSRMLDLLMGHITGECPGMNGCLKLYIPDPDHFPKSCTDPVQSLLRRLVQASEGNEGMGADEADPAAQDKITARLIGLFGEPGSGRRYQVRWLFSWLGRPLFLLDGARLSGRYDEDVVLMRNVLRECIYYQAGLMIWNVAPGHMDQALLMPIFDVLPVVFAGMGAKPAATTQNCGFDDYWLEIGRPDYASAVQLWQTMPRRLPFAPDVRPEEMADKYSLPPGSIKRVLDMAARKAYMGAKTCISMEELQAACHELLTADMGSKLLHIVPVYHWDDLVLPGFQKDMLRMGCDQVRYKNRVYRHWGFEQKNAYGRGTSMIFSGLPGTGKTMAAQVIAAELGMDLYKVELAAVVSKYVGETEKNLEEIFEKAKAGQVILFFDEADVLFSKRTEVRDSNDKYSNMEAAYMLQKIESYDGITILSTNYLQNFDEAFKRRMKMIIDFPFPGIGERARIWRRVFPETLPLAPDVDLDYLARQFEFSGSNIKNAALFAAFLAAPQNRSVTMADLIRGVKNECSKIGKNLGPEELGEYYVLFKEAQSHV